MKEKKEVNTMEAKPKEKKFVATDVILEAIVDGVSVADIEGRIIQANKAYAEMHGYESPGKLVGKPIFELVPKRELPRIKKMYIESIKKKEKVIKNLEIIHRRKDGSEFPIVRSITRLWDKKGEMAGEIAVIKDITERKEREAEIKRLKEYNENIVASIPTTIITCNKKLIIKSINKVRCTLCGRKRSEHIGKHLSQILGPEAIKNGKLDKKISEVLKTKEPSEEMEIRYHFPKIGDKVLNLKIVGISREEEVLLLINDITEKKELEERLRQADKLASVGQMAAGLAHEINNPIAIIKGNVQYMQKKVRNLLSAKKAGKDDIKECAGILGRIAEEGERCGNITSGLLQFARKGEDKVSPLDINEELATVLAIAEHNLSLGKIKVTQKLFPDLPKLLGNGDQLRQVFMNLIVNAQDAMPEGGNLTIESLHDRDDRNIEIKFTDTGQGIPRENIRKLFDPFFTTKKSGKGVGLDLSISYGIITARKGTIEVESRVGKGTTFTIKLPVTEKKRGYLKKK